MTTSVTPPPAAMTKPVVLPTPQHATPATAPSHAGRIDQKPEVTVPAPKETPAAANAPAKGAAQRVPAPLAKDDHKRTHPPEKKLGEQTSP